MRFLHTADWHVGKLLRSRSRLDEQEAVLQEILDIARREKVDCVLAAGDLFESQAPSPEAERLVYQFFAELLAAGIQAVIIGGNHDHPKRLAAIRTLLDPLHIYVRPEPCGPSTGGVIEIAKNGELARIAVLPWVPERKIVDIAQMFRPVDEWCKSYESTVSGMMEALTAGFAADSINILMAHLYVHNAITSASERAVHVSQPYAISPQQFPQTANYVALGHLHRPQMVGGTLAPGVYAGSPLQLDFGEQEQEKRVVLFNAKAGAPTHPESIPLSAGRRLRDLRGTLEELESMAEIAGTDFLRVRVRASVQPTGLADRIRELLPNAVDIQVEAPREAVVEIRAALGPQPPEVLFRHFYERQKNVLPSPDLEKLFLELYDEVLHETNPA